MTMLYDVVIADRNSDQLGPSCKVVRRVRRLTLTQARGVCERAARRGVKLYGGGVERLNWGACGGPAGFMPRQRSAAIYMHHA